MTPTDLVLVAALLATPFVAWRLCRWLEGLADRNGAVLADRTVQAARTKGPAIGWADFIDPTPCGVRYRRNPTLTYVCDRPPHDDRLHSEGSVRWYADGDLDDVGTDDLTAVADAVREEVCTCCDIHNRNCEPPSELCCWRCTDVAEGLYDHLAPTLREERINPLYASRVLTLYGPGFVHRGCLAARRDHATDHICGLCGKSFSAVAA